MAATGTTIDLKHEKSTANGLVLPEFPGEDPRQHLGTQWKEEADSRLAGAGLLTVANGGAPVEVAQIIDYPLDSIPELPRGHKDYARRQEARLKVQIDNERNKEKRAGMTMRAWADLYRAVKTCTEKTAPMLSRELISLCDMSLPHNGSHAMGWFDGPRAYRTVCERIFGGERTKEDKNYYKMAEHLQTQHRLPDGAPAAEFSKRVISFLTNIAPNLPQPMSADDISEYIFDLMPKACATDGRRIKFELKCEGRLHDHMEVAKRCRQLVFSEQDGAKPAPTVLLSAAELEFFNGADLTMLSFTTGVTLASGGAAAFAGVAGRPGKWCDNCPHPGGVTCFCDPAFEGPPPAAVYLNRERWRGIEKARQENSRSSGIPLATVKTPSREAIEKYKERKKEKGERRKQKAAAAAAPAPAPASGTPAGAAAGTTGTLDDFFADLLEISAPACTIVDVEVLRPSCDDGDGALPSTSSSVGVDGDPEPTASEEAQTEDDDDDDDDDDESRDGEPSMLWFVVAPVKDAASNECTLQCVAHARQLEIDTSTHFAIPFGDQEAMARDYIRGLLKAFEFNAPLAASGVRAVAGAARQTGLPGLSSCAPPVRPFEPPTAVRATGAAPATLTAASPAATVARDEQAELYAQRLSELEGGPQPAQRNVVSPCQRPLPCATSLCTVTAPSRGTGPTPLPPEIAANCAPRGRLATPPTSLALGTPGNTPVLPSLATPSAPAAPFVSPCPSVSRGSAPTPIPIAARRHRRHPSATPPPYPTAADPLHRGGPQPRAGSVRDSREVGTALAFGLLATACALALSHTFDRAAAIGTTVAGARIAANDHGGLELADYWNRATDGARTALYALAQFALDHALAVLFALLLVFFIRGSLGAPDFTGGGGGIQSSRTLSIGVPPDSGYGSLASWHGFDCGSSVACPTVEEPIRADHLTHEQAELLHTELLAGNAVPGNLPTSITRTICIIDSGCGKSMGNHPDQFESGSLYDSETKVQGAEGNFVTKQKGELRWPMVTDQHGVRCFREKDSILNRKCAFVLIAIGRASIEQGVVMVMNAWGKGGHFSYPGGVTVSFLNKSVFVLRPLGYKEPVLAGIEVAITSDQLGVPQDGDYVLYVGSGPGPPRVGSLTDCLAALHTPVTLVLIDPIIGGSAHNIVSGPVAAALVTASRSPRCKGVLVTIRCRTWSVSTWLPDAEGRPGKPYRDCDNVLGIPRRDGTRHPDVLEASQESTNVAAIARAAYFRPSSPRGFVIVEQPARRAGPKCLLSPDHRMRGAERATHMYEHPAWKRFIGDSGAGETTFHQCMTADPNVPLSERREKATVLLHTPNVSSHVEAGFGGGKFCTHPRNSHRPLRGADADGNYATSESRCENFDAGTNRLLAICIDSFVSDGSNATSGSWNSGGSQDATKLSLAAGVVQGKRLARGAVTHEFIHDSFGFAEARVLRNLSEAIEDFDPSWVSAIKDCPCDACLRAEAPRIGGSGALPRTEGLIYVDAWHVNIPCILTGHRIVIGAVHAASGLCKTVKVRHKSDSPGAIELICALWNSLGKPVSWIHSDGDNTLKGSGIVPLCRSKNIRVTMTVKNRSRQNRMEPQWRVRRMRVAKALAHGNLTVDFWGAAWCDTEDAESLLPSRAPPHDSALGRALSTPNTKVKPRGAYRRPFGCLCYPTIAERLPSGTLVNKPAQQSVRALNLGYVGNKVGSFEAVGPAGHRSQPGYLCYLPETNETIVTDDVRFVPACKPGLQRKAGGGWTIPLDKWTTSLENKLADMPSETAKAQQTEPIIDVLSEDQIKETGPERSFELAPGFPEEVESKEQSDEAESNANAPSRGGDADGASPHADTSTASPRPRYLVPRSHWPDYACTEHGGKGWEVEVIRRKGAWSECRFIKPDANGDVWPTEWRKHVDLLPLSKDAAEWETESPEPTSPPPPAVEPSPPATTRLPVEPVNFPTSQRDDEPRRSARERAQTERFGFFSHHHPASIAALAARYAEAAAVGFDATSHRLDATALYVNTEFGADRIIERGLALTSVGHDIPAYVDQLRAEYESLEPSAQRCVLIAADHDDIAAEYGTASPQAKMAREVYAAAAVASAINGVPVPPLEPLLTSLDSAATAVTFSQLFDDDGDHLYALPMHAFDEEIAAAVKAKSSPDDFTERQMRGAEWDEPKMSEINKMKRLGAKVDVAADDPKVAHLKPVETMWVGRRKLKSDGALLKLNARCVLRGDIHGKRYCVTDNQKTSPVVTSQSLCCLDAVACLREQHFCDYDVPGAYLQGDQLTSEQVLARAPLGFREYDERGVEIMWLMQAPLYGQLDAGAIWNRTINEFLTGAVGLERCPHDPCVYSKSMGADRGEDVLTGPLYVDDGRLYYDHTPAAIAAADDARKKLTERFGIEFGETDPTSSFFLGANRIADGRSKCSVRGTSYIDKMIDRYADGDVSISKRFPAHWSYLPSDDSLTKAWDTAVATRPNAPEELVKRYQSLFGALLYVVKFRPEVSATLQLCGTCLTFPTEEMYECLMHCLVYLGRTRNLGINFSKHAPEAGKLRAYADSNFSITRSVTGFCVMLAGASVSHASRRQHCITMSSCEAELVALADCAIELLYVMGVLDFIGFDITESVEVCTDSKAAYDLCHRFNSAQNSRHVDRKMFKMRELRGASVVTVRHIPGEENPADLFTKILTRQPFEKHRKKSMNLTGDTGVEFARRQRVAGGVLSPADGE